MKRLAVVVIRAVVLEKPPGERWTIDELTHYARARLEDEDLTVNRRRVELAIESLKDIGLVSFKNGDWEPDGDRIIEEARRGLWDLKNQDIWKEIYQEYIKEHKEKADLLSLFASALVTRREDGKR